MIFQSVALLKMARLHRFYSTLPNNIAVLTVALFSIPYIANVRGPTQGSMDRKIDFWNKRIQFIHKYRFGILFIRVRHTVWLIHYDFFSMSHTNDSVTLLDYYDQRNLANSELL